MKKLRHVVFAFILLLPGTFVLMSAGIQSRTAAVQYNQHDPQKGLKLLEEKTNHTVSVVWNEHNSTPTFVGGTLTPAGYSTSTDKSVDGKKFIAENAEMFGLKDASKELEVISNVTDDRS